jgi:3-oxoadipate enol-lactonase
MSVSEGAKMPPRRRGYLARPDCRILYEVTGSGPAIVFAHGLGGNHLSWWQQVAHFSPRFTCVTFAHRGFAPSSPLPDGPDPADYADDLAALVAELGLVDVRLVAQSMGGWTAVEYALRRPPGLRAVVLAATTGPIDPQRLPAADRAPIEAWTASASGIRSELARRGIHPAAGARMAEEQPDLHLLYRHIDDMNADLDKEALRGRLMAGRVRAPRVMADIACPVLMIGNDEDCVMPPMAAEAMARIAPNVRAARIAKAGHSAYFERAGLFNELVEEFFAALP